MITILVGCAIVWGLVTGMTGGNWVAGLIVALVVLGSVNGGRRRMAEQRQREARQQLFDDFAASMHEPTRKGWF